MQRGLMKTIDAHLASSDGGTWSISGCGRSYVAPKNLQHVDFKLHKYDDVLRLELVRRS